jgi:hypothetical protein
MPMTISGSGSITGLTAGGLPDASVQQADLAVNVAATGPVFCAYASGSQSIPNSTATKIAFQVEEYDSNNAFDSVTNSRFQPAVAGYYQFNSQLSTNGTGVGYLSLYKTGVEYKRGHQSNSSTTSFTVSSLVFLNGTTDYVELWFFQASGAALLTSGPAGGVYSYFNGALVRAA